MRALYRCHGTRTHIFEQLSQHGYSAVQGIEHVRGTLAPLRIKIEELSIVRVPPSPYAILEGRERTKKRKTTMSTSGKDSDEQRKSIIESQLKGNTLRVYVYVVTHRKSGVREVQRALHFSSSSLAQYHLAKLVDLGLLTENGGEYHATEQVKVDVLKDFLKLGTFIVPRFVFYAVFFSIITGFLSFVVFFEQDLGAAPTIEFWFVGLLIIVCGLFWYEALRAWLKGPV
jgi:hypothetical protein